MINGFAVVSGILLDPSAAVVLQIHDPVEFLRRQSFFIDDRAVGIRQRNYFGAQRHRFGRAVLCDIARTGNHHPQTFKRHLARGQHFTGEIDVAIAGGLRPDATAAPVQTAPRNRAVGRIGDLFVLAEKITDFTRTDPDIAGRHVGIGTDMAVKLTHHILTKAHDLVFTLPLGVEIGAALAAAHRQRSQRILENLLESEKFQDTRINRRMKPQTAFVWTDRTVELNPATDIDLNFALVIHPWNLKDDGALRNHQSFQNAIFLILWLPVQQFAQRPVYFRHALDKLLFPAALLLQPVQHFSDITVHRYHKISQTTFPAPQSQVKKRNLPTFKKRVTIVLQEYFSSQFKNIFSFFSS
ncbi:hypothetical protein SDC9_109004 [bioreactor metagenome]|uniref:Uncharacterized protein n=1 Tax=bioreactor metagenome TaxID=1076179 RepID=A0A645BAR7_9ZZZZ